MRKVAAFVPVLSVALALAPAAACAADRPAYGPAPYDALFDEVRAGEIVLANICLPGILEAKPIGELATYNRLLKMSARTANVGPEAEVWRLASLSAVNAIAWKDGSCSAYVDRGPADKLRAMAERVILARPEGFARGSSAVVDNGRVERTVYCARAGDEWLVATITTPNGKAARGTRALSSTVYRRPGPSPLCAPG
jgi:hypothetical protein